MAITKTVREASIAVAEAEATLAAAQAALTEAEASAQELTPEQLLAIDLHDTLCRWNHTDGCGWHYEIKNRTDHQWDRSEHKRYLEKAQELSTQFPDLDTGLACEFIRAAKTL